MEKVDFVMKGGAVESETLNRRTSNGRGVRLGDDSRCSRDLQELPEGSYLLCESKFESFRKRIFIRR